MYLKPSVSLTRKKGLQGGEWSVNVTELILLYLLEKLSGFLFNAILYSSWSSD